MRLEIGKCLVLKPLKKLKRPQNKNVIGFDIETKGNKNDFVLACLIGDNIKIHFTDKETFFNYINTTRKLTNYIIVATNLQFDFLGSFSEHKEYFRVFERGTHIYRIDFYQNKDVTRKITFYDTLNYFPASVEQLGNFLKVPKLPLPNCFKRQPKNFEEFEELKTYCYNDALISFKFFKFLLNNIKKQKSKLKSTIASTSMDLFRRCYLKTKYYIEPVNIHKITLKAYYGGRTETFKRGTFNNVSCYDVNSLYPFAMLNRYPDPNSFKYTKLSNNSLISRYEGVTYIEGYIPPMYVPPLPYRTVEKLIFPVGNIKGYYTHIELRNALLKGLRITKFGESVFYTKTCQPFRRYVLDLYKKRNQLKAKKDPMELLVKLELNSLYGKFAYKYYSTNEILHISQITPEILSKFEDFVVHQEKNIIELKNKENWKKPTHYSIPIWSVYCTAYARLLMYEILGNKEYHKSLIYTDTDSIFLTNKNMVESNELGEYKLEYNIEKAVFVKPKFYLTTKPRIKGVKNLKTKEQFYNIINDRKVTQEYFIKFRTATKSEPNHKYGKLNYNQIIKRTKTLSLEDTKRKWYHKFNMYKRQDSKAICL